VKSPRPARSACQSTSACASGPDFAAAASAAGQFFAPAAVSAVAMSVSDSACAGAQAAAASSPARNMSRREYIIAPICGGALPAAIHILGKSTARV